MPDTHLATPETVDALFDKLGTVHAGMLGVEGSGSHMRPMTHFADAKGKRIWFFTHRDSAIAREVGQGATAHYCLVDSSDGYYACLSGYLRQSDDADKVDSLWSPLVAAWFTGRDDPDLMLLELALRDGETWTVTNNRLQLGLEFAKANMRSEEEPDIGTHKQILF